MGDERITTEHQVVRKALWPRLQVAARRLFNRLPLRERQKIYLLTLLIGGLCGLAAVSFHLLLDFFQAHFIYAAAAVEHWWRWLLVILVPALGGLIAGAGLYFFAPDARGSGIPQVKAAYYLEGGRILARVIPARMLLSAINIGTGASLGREGPTVQICAALASTLGRLFAVRRRTLQSLVPVGAAAGLAAAFNTPIAAVTFTLEEILGDAAGKPLGSIVIAAVIAAVVERSILGEHPVFAVPAYRLGEVRELFFYALLGCIAGLAAVVFQAGTLWLRGVTRDQRLVPQWAAPGAGGLILGGVGLLALWLTGSASVFGVGYGQLGDVLQNGAPLKVLLVLGACKLAGTVISYGTGSAGGIFGPSLYVGGMIGGAVGLLTQLALGGQTQPGAFALVGMGAFFAGVVRAPVTSIIIIFEMTGSYSLILPLMIANIISYAVAYELSPVPIYDALLRQDGVRLPQTERETLKQISVGTAMTDRVVTLAGELRVAEAFDYLNSLPETHLAYPIVDAGGRLTGLLTYNDLKRTLAQNKGVLTLGEVAARRLTYVHGDQTLQTALIRLGRAGVSLLPVVAREDVTKLLGVITTQDIARALSDGTESES
ncbi:MAG: chloride channel protein [Blastocatellia bacterium]